MEILPVESLSLSLLSKKDWLVMIIKFHVKLKYRFMWLVKLQFFFFISHLTLELR